MRMCGRKNLSTLFTKGLRRSFSLFHCYLLSGRRALFPSRALFSVSRKQWKRAVDRNLIRRRMREVYRLSSRPTMAPYWIAFVYKKEVRTIVAYEGFKQGMEEVMQWVGDVVSRCGVQSA